MRFRDVPGHAALKDTLRRLVASGQLPHALLLAGPSGNGGMMLARALAQAVHCEAPEEGEACGRCPSCRRHADLSHPDLHWVYPIVKSQARHVLVSSDMAAEWRGMLSEWPSMPYEKWLDAIAAGNSQPLIYVDEADAIVRADSYPSYSGGRKAFIVWLPEKLQPAAANKLLKVIEEPSPDTLFIFVSENEQGILPTVFSRLQRYKVPPLDEAEMRGYLAQRYHMPPEKARQCARLARGSLAKADSLGRTDGEEEEFLGIYRDIMRAAYARKVGALRALADRTGAFGREKTRRLLDYMARMLRENFIANLRNPALNAMNTDEEDFARRFSPFVNHTNIEDFALQTDLAARDIARNANARLVLFDYFIHIIILLHRKQNK